MAIRLLPLLALALLGPAAGGSHAAAPPAALCDVPAGDPTMLLASARGELPAYALRGLAGDLRQYPDVGLASPAQRARAARILADARRAARAWRDPRAATAAGFDARRPRRSGDRVGFFHAEHRRFSGDGRVLDPRRPEVLIYANAPGRPLALVGVMFSVPRGRLGPTPAGAILRWHSHRVCAQGGRRGLAPRPDGTCPPGSALRRGSEMLHVWFTSDLRSAFAIRAPEPELCDLRLLPAAHCDGGGALRTM